MWLRIIASILVLAALSGCALFASKQTFTLTTGQAAVSLDFVDSATVIGKFQASEPSSVSLSFNPSESERKVLRECGATEEDLKRYEESLKPRKTLGIPLLLPVLGLLTASAIDLTLDEVERRLAERLKKYLAAYSASRSMDFYQPTAQGTPALAWKCFRFTRAVGPKDEPSVVMDLIGQFWLSPQRDALKIRPLRLYYEKAKAEGDHVGISVSVGARAVWREHNIGKSEKIFEHTLLSEKFDMTNKVDDLKYYPTQSWQDHPFLPLVPWSTNFDIAQGGGHVEFTVAVAEVGVPPKILEVTANLFKARKGEIERLMNNAANALLSSGAK